jgi:hypothetical protein
VSHYPDDELLAPLKDWPANDLDGLMEHIEDYWNEYGRIWKEGGQWHLATGGWSGNEDILECISTNHIFWSLHWQSSARGGKYVFGEAKDAS